MTDPVDSLIDKLNRAADLGTGGTQRTDLFRAAADALEKAPHTPGCASLIPMHFHKSWPCDCWKALL